MTDLDGIWHRSIITLCASCVTVYCNRSCLCVVFGSVTTITRPAPPGRGLQRGKDFGSALPQPVRSICVSSECFFSLLHEIDLSCCKCNFRSKKNQRSRTVCSDTDEEVSRSVNKNSLLNTDKPVAKFSDDYIIHVEY